MSNDLLADEEQIRVFVDCLFRHAEYGTVVGLRSFTHQKEDQIARIQGWPRIGGDNDTLITAAVEAATVSANDLVGLVFAPPVATFTEQVNGQKQQARLVDLANGLCITVELDEGDIGAHRQKLEVLLGLATVVVASGGVWIDPETGEIHEKLHLHWRLSEPTLVPDEHAKLRAARNLAALLVGADMTAVPLVHPLRWPGSWHRKDKSAPKLCKILASDPSAEVHLDDALTALQEAVEATGLKLGDKKEGPHAPGEPQAFIGRLRPAVLSIPNTDTTSWDDWNTMGLRIHRATGGSSDGLELWIDWSLQSGKYIAGECQARWQHFHAHPFSRSGAGTLFYMAKVYKRTGARSHLSRPESLDGVDVQPDDDADLPADAEAGSQTDVLAEVEAMDDGENEGDNADNLVSLDIARLIRLPVAAYEAERQAVADKHGIRVGALDAERRKLESKVRAAEKAKERVAAQKAKAAQSLVKQEQVQQEKEAKLDAAWRAAEARAEHRAKAAPDIEGTIWPYGIEARADGLYYAGGSEDQPPLWLCDPIEILGQGRDADGESWGLLLKWKDADQCTKTWPMPSRLLVTKLGDFEGELLCRGFRLDTNNQQRAHLRYALGGAKCSARVSFAEAPGWNAPAGGANAFVLIDGETVGSPSEQIVLKAPPEAAKAKMRQAGTLDEWKEGIAAKAVGNTVAAFSICAAFAGPLLKPLGEVSGGFHFYGRSKAGKTLATKLGVSVWGPTNEPCLLRSWRSTSNGLESAAEECNDALLVLDEVQQAEPKDVVSSIYLLANERGKQRLKQDATAKRARSWRTVVLSNGEHSLDAMAAKAAQTLPAGAETRLPSIPIGEQPMWPALHGAVSSVALISGLHKVLPTQHGTAIRPFLAALAETIAENDGTLGDALEELRKGFNDKLPSNADAQVRDVSRRCALIALAGELAIEWDILPWSAGEAKRAARQVLAWWLERRGGTGSEEDHQHVKAIRSFLVEYGTSRFVALKLQKVASGPSRWVEQHPERLVASRMGWRHMTENDEGGAFLIDPDGWGKVCAAANVDPLEAARTLKKAGHLGDGDGKNLARSVRVPGIGRTRAYIILPSIFAGEEVGTVAEASNVSEQEFAE